jgi:TolB-like protein/Flp pilus assembly protein TadD
MKILTELKRRNVIRMAGLYLVGAWLLVQVAGTVLPMFGAPDWLPRSIVILLAIGFVQALIFSWVFELTQAGLKRDEDVKPEESIAPQTARRMDRMIIGVLILALGYFAVDKFVLAPRRAAAPNDLFSGVSAKSIAVLPFENLSEDKANAYFTEGIQDEILTRLAKIADLKVISRTSTQHFKSSPGNLPLIARQLGVANILEGSVQKVNDQVRVNVQLINAMTDAHLWADTYDRKLIDIFAVETEIAKTIAETLRAKLTGSEETLIAKKPTANPEAYELYLKGRFFWNKRGAVNLRKSIDYFQQAIEKDPNYALAYAGLAQAWDVLPGHNGGAPKDCYPQAEAAARKALSLDEDLADARTTLADVKAQYNYDFPGALIEFERVLQRHPNDATAHHWFANNALTALGQSERAVAEMRRALALDPLSLIINTNLGYACLFAGQPDEAIAQLRKTLEMDGGFALARAALGQALELKGQIPEAMAEYQKAVALSNDPNSLGLLGHLYGITGRKDEATKILEQLKETRHHGYFDAVPLALVSLGLGDRDQALDWLEQGFQERSSWLMYMRIEPLLKPLHGDPRFEALAEKIVPASEFGKSATPSK